MLNIVLCDDNAQERDYIKSLVLDWADRSGADIAATEYPSAEAFLFSYEDLSPDIILLDIEMPRMNGVELAKKLRACSETVLIIFITGYPDFISEGYEVEALHYLLKPVTPQKLGEVLDRAVSKISRVEKKILLPSEGGETAVSVRDIHYIEVQRQYSVIYTVAGRYRIKAPLTELESRLDDYFLRVQRSFIVNLREVVKITRTGVILKSGAEVPISRGTAEKVSRKIIELF